MVNKPRLTDEQAHKAKWLAHKGVPNVEIGKFFGVGEHTIRKIVLGQRYVNILPIDQERCGPPRTTSELYQNFVIPRLLPLWVDQQRTVLANGRVIERWRGEKL